MILMLLNSDVLRKVFFLTGSLDEVERIKYTKTLQPFNSQILDFLSAVSEELMGSKEAKAYPDVVTFAFMIRKASLYKLKNRFQEDNVIKLGKGVVFHIAPSNVPVNFAYSLLAGLLTGNSNVVRVPSTEFIQVKIITDAFRKVLEQFEDIKPYLICVRYERNREINDLFSSLADMRIVWGGDRTIDELRKSPLLPRAGEITFADRYSIAVIESNSYLQIKDKRKVAEAFYNDTFLTDQNACTSPRIIVWTGNRIDDAKATFWNEERKVVEKLYSLQPIQAVDKLTQAYKFAAMTEDAKIESHVDNLIIRINVAELTKDLMEMRGNSGYFYEYDCNNLLEILPLIDDKRCQTIGYIGDKKALISIVEAGIKGVDRIVPIGRSMDFDLIWDGYNLPATLTRTVTII